MRGRYQTDLCYVADKLPGWTSQRNLTSRDLLKQLHRIRRLADTTILCEKLSTTSITTGGKILVVIKDVR